jgi:hypothetical protein
MLIGSKGTEHAEARRMCVAEAADIVMPKLYFS